MSGLDFQATLALAKINTPLVFMSGHGDVPMTVRAMKAGAVDFLIKPFRDQDMLDAVATAIERNRARLSAEKATAELRAHLATLSRRERETMLLVTTGLMNKQVAGSLGLCEATVKMYRGQAMKKMGAKSLAELARMAELSACMRATGERNAPYRPGPPMTSLKEIVVTGASGQLGRLVVADLLGIAPEAHVIGIRNPAAAKDLTDRGVELRAAATRMPPLSPQRSRAPTRCF
jgi:FixJ family two-component response regulator